ncbi:MAG: hypothetical protein QXH51_06495 [Candidatus Bathyarchaeia archaeon]
MYKRFVLAPLLALLFATVALASVFVYYPLYITATPTEPKLVFDSGSNANQPDIGTGNQIQVSIGENKTFASITIHPTYQENYYKNVLNITNGDDNAVNVSIIFTSVDNELPSGSNVTMIIYCRGTRINLLNITLPEENKPIWIGQIDKDNVWEIDFYVYIPEGTYIMNKSYTAIAKLVYTPSPETPPSEPSKGR